MPSTRTSDLGVSPPSPAVVGVTDEHSNVGYDPRAHSDRSRLYDVRGDDDLIAWLALRKDSTTTDVQRAVLPESVSALHITAPGFLTFDCRETTIRVDPSARRRRAESSFRELSVATEPI